VIDPRFDDSLTVVSAMVPIRIVKAPIARGAERADRDSIGALTSRYSETLAVNRSKNESDAESGPSPKWSEVRLVRALANSWRFHETGFQRMLVDAYMEAEAVGARAEVWRILDHPGRPFEPARDVSVRALVAIRGTDLEWVEVPPIPEWERAWWADRNPAKGAIDLRSS